MFMFSPILAIIAASFSSTVIDVSSAHFSALNASISAASVFAACSTTSLTNVWNTSFFATKSVSALTSTIAATLSPSLIVVATSPSAAILPAFFSAVASPFSRRNSIALSKSPSVAESAFLQSIIPAPVISLNSFTILAVTAIFFVLQLINVINQYYLVLTLLLPLLLLQLLQLPRIRQRQPRPD